MPFTLMIAVLAGGRRASVSAGLLRDFLSARVQSQALSGMRQSMFERLQRITMSFHSHQRTADLLERFSTDFAAIENAVARGRSPGAPFPLLEALLRTGLMLWLNWRAGLAGFLLWPWILLAPRIPAARITRASEACEEDELRVLGALKENLSGAGDHPRLLSRAGRNRRASGSVTTGCREARCGRGCFRRLWNGSRARVSSAFRPFSWP